MNKVDNLFKRILEEEMSAEMRTWLMEMSLLIDEERALRQPTVSGRSKLLLDFSEHLNSYEGMQEIRFDFMVRDYLDKIIFN